MHLYKKFVCWMHESWDNFSLKAKSTASIFSDLLNLSLQSKSTQAHQQSSGLTVPDGMPMVWIVRLNGFKDISRGYGPELMMEICRVSLRKGAQCIH